MADEDVTELLDSHVQQLSNEDLEEIAKELSQQKEEENDHVQQLSNEDLEEMAKELSQQKEEENEKDEEPPLKCMKTSNLQCILSAMETLTDEICDNAHSWE